MASLENQTVKALRALAKERGLKRYSHLRISELVAMLQPRNITEVQPRNIMDEPVPNIGVAPLIPHSITHGVRNAVSYLRDMTGRVASKVKRGFSDFANWMMNYTPVPRAADPVIQDILSLYPQLREKERSVRGWFKTFHVPGMPNHDVRSFMENVKPEVLELYEREEFRRGFKTRFILNVEMEKRDLVTGDITTTTPSFHSQSQIVLEYTSESEIYDLMIQQILERIAGFNNRGSNWTLRSIIGLDIFVD